MKKLGSRQTNVPGFDRNYGLLTATTAMPCPSFSLPPVATCPGRSKADDSVCRGCYCRGGAYTHRTPAAAQAARLYWTKDSMRNAASRTAWVDTMVAAIEKTGCARFRWHDSGDVFSARYAQCILRVIDRTPHVKHWLPTRSYTIPAILRVLRIIHNQFNATVRPSAMRLNQRAPRVAGLGAGTTVYTVDPVGLETACPKTIGDVATCEAAGCRRCWGGREQIGYKYHPPRSGTTLGDNMRRKQAGIIKHTFSN